MTRKDKLIKRLLSKPKDFTWNELTSLLARLGFEEIKTGKTSGSRRRFINANAMVITLHRKAAIAAIQREMNLNKLVTEALEQYLN
jgi:hypothetical protein